MRAFIKSARARFKHSLLRTIRDIVSVCARARARRKGKREGRTHVKGRKDRGSDEGMKGETKKGERAEEGVKVHTTGAAKDPAQAARGC